MHKKINVIDVFKDENIKDYTNKKPTKYKHTFKKVNNEYVWYSTEIEK